MAAREFTNNYYAVLQISEDADENTIKSSYKRLALRNHPDRSQVPNATAEFQKVQEAYEVLRDPHQRYCFNAQLPRIRRDAAVKNSSASNRESYFDCNGQSPQLYAQSIYELERKLCDLANEVAKLHQDRDAKVQKLQKHKAAIQRLLNQDYEAAKDDDKRNTWMSILTLKGYTRPEQEQRKRAAMLRLFNRRDQEDIVRDLEAERDRLSVKIVSLHAEISQIGVQKRGLENARLRQAAAKAKAEEQQRQLNREQQNAEEKARKAREEQLKREEKEQLEKEKVRLARKEKEEQMSRERQQRMVWEAEKRHTKESYQYARTAKQSGGFSKSDKQSKEESRNDIRHGRESKVKYEAGGKGSTTQQKRPFNPKSKMPNTHRTKDFIDVDDNRNCKHRKFWTKVEGRIECGRCHFTQHRFAFRCPGCQIFACASCRDLVKNDSS